MDQVINLCEMKYSAAEYIVTKNDDEDIRRKIDVFIRKTGTKHAIFPTLVITYGMAENVYSGIFQSVITLDDLFAE